MGKWLHLPQGREEYVQNEDTVKRLLGDGAYEVPDPTLPQDPAVKQTQASESDDKPAEQIVKPAQSAKKTR
jgi:hypothetical protein